MDPSANSGGIGDDDPEFLRFDVVSDCSDHHYFRRSLLDNADQGCFSNAASRVHKRIVHEWKILQSNLPDSIYVRVYETRIDLLRSVVIGAPGTPYHDGLFFFDFAFPSDYPARPPLVHYRSFGMRINPNLYANGRVCVSLLNTWPGKGSEKWDPSQSTILQVLLSLQGLVLNERPYFNEPVHGSWRGRKFAEKKSTAYSEGVFALSCKTMLNLLRKPPKNFEGFVASHFRDRGRGVLAACQTYASGSVKVGLYRDCGSSSSSGSSSAAEASSKFKAALAILYPMLFAAFAKNGASLETLDEQLRMEGKNDSSESEATVAKKKRGFANMIVGKLKKILGLKKGAKDNAGSSNRSRATLEGRAVH